MSHQIRVQGQQRSKRYREMLRILEERRREIVTELHEKMRDVRAQGGVVQVVLDAGENSETDVRQDIEFALIQMKSDTLTKIEEALRRLGKGTYGNCFDCGEHISAQRLRALPFAVRCKECEEAREAAQGRERLTSQRRGGGISVFFDVRAEPSIYG